MKLLSHAVPRDTTSYLPSQAGPCVTFPAEIIYCVTQRRDAQVLPVHAGAEREHIVEQLQSVEQQLQRSQSADIITELVSAKILAADKDYLALELQVMSNIACCSPGLALSL